MSETVGIIGLGNVGYFFGVNLEKAGKSIIVFDVDKTKSAALAGDNIKVAENAAEIAQKSDIILLSLPNPDIIKLVLVENDKVLDNAKQGSLIIDISTIDPETSTFIYHEAKQRGVNYLEAPMSGGQPDSAGVDGARNANVTFLTAGDKEAYERALPTLNILGHKAFYLGEIGRGNTLKLISNQLAGLYMAIAGEAFALGTAAGFDYETMLEVFKETDAKSYTMFNEFNQHLLSDDYDYGFPVDLQHKDHRLMQGVAQKLGVPLFFNSLSMEMYKMASAQGMGRKSHTIVIKAIAKMMGVTLPEVKK